VEVEPCRIMLLHVFFMFCLGSTAAWYGNDIMWNTDNALQWHSLKGCLRYRHFTQFFHYICYRFYLFSMSIGITHGSSGVGQGTERFTAETWVNLSNIGWYINKKTLYIKYWISDSYLLKRKKNITDLESYNKPPNFARKMCLNMTVQYTKLIKSPNWPEIILHV